jgi:transposase InsO family protein
VNHANGWLIVRPLSFFVDHRSATGASPSLGEWINGYNRHAPHSALGMRPPAEYRRA